MSIVFLVYYVLTSELIGKLLSLANGNTEAQGEAGPSLERSLAQIRHPGVCHQLCVYSSFFPCKWMIWSSRLALTMLTSDASLSKS